MSIKILEKFPKEILLMDIVDVKYCVMSRERGDIDSISRQIWEGSRSIFRGIMRWGFLSDIFDSSSCDGIKDIIHEWDRKGIETLIFYIPTPTIQEIKKKLGGKVNPRDIVDRIEGDIIANSNNAIANLYVCSLEDKSSGVEDIFDIEALRLELDRDSRESGESIYLLGLKYNLSSQNISFYLNNSPVRIDGGTILGNSTLLKHRLKRGFVSVNTSNKDIELSFHDSDEFISKNQEINESLKYMNFSSDISENLYMQLYRANSPIILESRSSEKLYFSERKLSSSDKLAGEPTINRLSNLYLESFFTPIDKDLKRLELLLIDKNGKNIITGGQYRVGLPCEVIAEVSVDLLSSTIRIKNRSNSDLIFSDYGAFWKLDSAKNRSSLVGEVVTDFISGSELLKRVSDMSNLDKIPKDEVGQKSIKSKESFLFNTSEIEFNDSNIFFDSNGISIRYSDFLISTFEKEFSINRTSPKISDSGTIIDSFMRPISRSNFESGGKIYSTYSDILGRAISSKPIKLKHIRGGLEIINRLDPKAYVVQVSTLSGRYILGKKESRVLIKKSELKSIKLEIINKQYIKKPLLQFELKFD